MSCPPTESMLQVVLVEPGESLNIGSVARAMSNFGVRDLHLVSPRGYDRTRAGITACWGEEVLNSARLWSSLDDALAPCDDVIGFSARSGKNLPAVLTVEEFASSVRERGHAARTALLFGPEDTGLRREHLERCRCIVRIPTCTENPSLNLAQAAVVALYEITRGGAFEKSATEPRATAAQYLVLDSLIDDLMKRSEFMNAGTPTELPGLVHSLFRRTQATEREMQILLGMMSRISKKIR